MRIEIVIRRKRGLADAIEDGLLFAGWMLLLMLATA